MPGFDEKRYVHAYDQFFEGDSEPLRELTAEDYVLHIPSFDLHISGREKALDWLRQLTQQVNIRQRVEKVESHGDFVITQVTGTSDLRSEEYRGVDVVRVNDEGRAVESHLHRPPLPPGTEVPTG